ncbi:hypothetical protein CDAR_295361 [Caerostris darwini]|uniref:Uncharacterized protein n=1 Tax=Caerostris darwini TaxID=1538125 RepID=A0AAV4QWF8_9ARAC|nr:hypothetical protein CDAR_295361 [Caerostris darwini]
MLKILPKTNNINLENEKFDGSFIFKSQSPIVDLMGNSELNDTLPSINDINKVLKSDISAFQTTPTTNSLYSLDQLINLDLDKNTLSHSSADKLINSLKLNVTFSDNISNIHNISKSGFEIINDGINQFPLELLANKQNITIQNAVNHLNMLGHDLEDVNNSSSLKVEVPNERIDDVYPNGDYNKLIFLNNSNDSTPQLIIARQLNMNNNVTEQRIKKFYSYITNIIHTVNDSFPDIGKKKSEIKIKPLNVDEFYKLIPLFYKKEQNSIPADHTAEPNVKKIDDFVENHSSFLESKYDIVLPEDNDIFHTILHRNRKLIKVDGLPSSVQYVVVPYQDLENDNQI